MAKAPAKKKKAAPKKRAATKRTSKSSSKKSLPGWVWMITGIVAGLFLAFLFYLAGIVPPPSALDLNADTDEAIPKQTPTKSPSKTTAKPKPAEEKPKFDFYTMLPENEVEVPEEPVVQPSAPTIYILQAGSFKSAADADKVRAKLILLGMDASIDSGKSKSGTTWHRVLVGPYTSRSKMSKARSTLISNGVDVLLLKRKG